MNHRMLRIIGSAIGAVVCLPAVYAQESNEAPKPAMGGDNIGALQSGAPADVPDTRPLAGIQNLSLGSQSNSHSFLLPSFGVTSAIQFVPDNNRAGNSSPITTTYLSGRLALNKTSKRSELLVDYLASGGFSTASGNNNSVIQSLDFSESIRGGRWSQTFGEQFTYLPGSSFNFGGVGGLGGFGINLASVGTTPGFRQDLLPNQSIITNGSDRISNSVMTQTGYALGYRSSLSFFGGYGTLHFLDGGLQDSSNISAGAGYNYLLSPLNSFSVSYGYGRFMFSHLSTTAESHSITLSFARRITGRLSFQAGAGPDIQVYDSPVIGSRTVVSWALNSGLNYQLKRWQTGFSYSHALSGGSGVLTGAETDLFSGHAGRSFGSWQGGISAGYARNHAIQQLSGSNTTSQGWFAGAQVSRSLARFGSLNVAYNVSRQSGLGAVCNLAACVTSGLTQTVSIGYNWGFRPILLE